MAIFIAQTSRGLVSALRQEMEELGLKVLKEETASVSFKGNWADCYRANLWLRTATRVILPVLDFPAYQNEDIYNNTKKHDYTKYITPDQTLMVDVALRDSKFKDSRWIALKVKDAIVDQFTDKYGRRPDVSKDRPDMRVQVRMIKNQVSISIDTSGENLSQRGYRREAGEAPIREHLAAGLLRLAGWKPGQKLVDPMCGSGTFLIEAAMIAKNMAPGSLRKGFAFQRFQGFQAEVWDEIVSSALDGETEAPVEGEEVSMWGSDINRKVLQAAERNAERAGVEDMIAFEKTAVDALKVHTEDKGMIVVNPPYGERLGSLETAKDDYRDLAYAWKRQFQGWDAWLLSGQPELTQALKLKGRLKIPVFNGPIDCRWVNYQIRA